MGLILGIIACVIFAFAGFDFNPVWGLTDVALIAFGLVFATAGAILGWRRTFTIS